MDNTGTTHKNVFTLGRDNGRYWVEMFFTIEWPEVYRHVNDEAGMKALALLLGEPQATELREAADACRAAQLRRRYNHDKAGAICVWTTDLPLSRATVEEFVRTTRRAKLEEMFNRGVSMYG